MLSMKKLSYAIAVSLSLSGAAFAGQDGAFAALQAAAPALDISVPAALPQADPDRALASDVLDLTPSYADFLGDYAKGLGYAVFELDGSKMTTKQTLLVYSTRVLRFPGVPENWDAMVDYIGELPRVHHNNHILIVVRNSNKVRLANAGLYADLREVAEFACRNAREWSKGDITIKFAFVQ